MAERRSISTVGVSLDFETLSLLAEIARSKYLPISRVVEDALWAYRPIKVLAGARGIEKPAPRKRGRPKKESVSAPA